MFALVPGAHVYPLPSFSFHGGPHHHRSEEARWAHLEHPDLPASSGWTQERRRHWFSSNRGRHAKYFKGVNAQQHTNRSRHGQAIAEKTRAHPWPSIFFSSFKNVYLQSYIWITFKIRLLKSLKSTGTPVTASPAGLQWSRTVSLCLDVLFLSCLQCQQLLWFLFHLHHYKHTYTSYLTSRLAC